MATHTGAAMHATTAVRSAIRREQATGVSCPITRRLARSTMLGISGTTIDRIADRITALEG